MKKFFSCVMVLLTAMAVANAAITTTADDNVIVDNCETVTSAPAHILAYDLAVDSTATGYVFSFKANMIADSAALVFYDNDSGTYLGEIVIPSVSDTNNVIPVQTNALPAHGQAIKWAVRLTGPNNAAFAKIFETAKISGRIHLAVDANPESPYMGQAYLFGRNNAKATGMYIMDQQHNLSNRHNFGLTQINSGFMRPCVDENGMVWVTDDTHQHPGIWIVDPANPDVCTQFFQGTPDAIGMYMNNDVRVGGPGTACFIYGKGESRKLFAHLKDDTDYITPTNYVTIYDIGTAYTWNSAPTATHTTQYNSIGNNALYVVEQGYWLSQLRDSGLNTAVNPALQFFAMDGILLANFGDDPRIDGCAVAGLTVDTVNNRLYLADGSRNILEFNVSYDAVTNVPTLDLIGKHYTGFQNISSMSLDFAGNLYITGGGYGTSSLNKMQVAIYSPATSDNTTLVPAREPILFPSAPTSLTLIEPQDQPTKLLRNGHLLIQKNGTTYNSLGQIVQ